MYYEKDDKDFFNSNLIRVYNHFCKLINIKSEYEFVVGPDGALVTRNNKAEDAPLKKKEDEEFVLDPKRPDVINIYAHNVYIAFAHYNFYNHTHKNCYFKLARVIMRLYKYVFLGPSFHTKEDRGLVEVDYNMALFNWNTLLKHNPALYYRIEGKSILERLHDELGDLEERVKLHWFHIFQKEHQMVGDESTYYQRVVKINEIPIDINTNPFLEFQTYNEDLQAKVKLSRKFDNKFILHDQRYEFDKVFFELMDMVRIRYLMKCEHADPLVYFDPYDEEDTDEISKKIVKYRGVIITDNYRDLFLIYEFLIEIVKNLKDLQNVPMVVEEVKNNYKVLENSIKYRFVNVLISKEVHEHKGYFEVRIFHKNHFSYFNLDTKVYNFEKIRYSCKEKYFDEYHKHYRVHIDTEFNYEALNLSNDYNLWAKRARALEREIEAQEKLIKEKDEYIERLRNMKSKAAVKFNFHNWWIIQSSYLTQLVYFIMLIIFCVFISTAYISITSTSSNLNDSIITTLTRQNLMIENFTNLEAQNVAQENILISYTPHLTELASKLVDMRQTAIDLEQEARNLYNKIYAATDDYYLVHIDAVDGYLVTYEDSILVALDQTRVDINDVIDSTRVNFVNKVISSRDDTMTQIDTRFKDTDTSNSNLSVVEDFDDSYTQIMAYTDDIQSTNQPLAINLKAINQDTYSVITHDTDGYLARLNTADTAIMDSIDTKTASILSDISAMDTKAVAIWNTIDDTTNGLFTTLDTYHSNIMATLDDADSSINALTNSSRNTLASLLDSTSATMVDQIHASDAVYLAAINVYRNAVITNENDVLTNLINDIDTHETTIVNTAVSRYNTLQGHNTDLYSKVDSTYDLIAQDVLTLLNTMDTEIHASSDQARDDIIDNIDNKYNSILQALNTYDKVSNLNIISRADSLIGNLTTQINTQYNTIYNNLAAKQTLIINDTGDWIDTTQTTLLANVATNKASVIDEIEINRSTLYSTIDSSEDTLTTLISSNVASIQATVGDYLSTHEGTMSTSLVDLRSDMKDSIDSYKDSIDTVLTAVHSDILDHMDDTGNQPSVLDNSDTKRDALKDTMDSIYDTITDSSDAHRDTIVGLIDGYNTDTKTLVVDSKDLVLAAHQDFDTDHATKLASNYDAADAVYTTINDGTAGILYKLDQIKTELDLV